MAWLSLMLIPGKHAMQPPKSPHRDETAFAVVPPPTSSKGSPDG